MGRKEGIGGKCRIYMSHQLLKKKPLEGIYTFPCISINTVFCLNQIETQLYCIGIFSIQRDAIRRILVPTICLSDDVAIQQPW